MIEGKHIDEGALYRANSNLTGSVGLAVKIVGDGLVDLASTGAEAIAGILQDDGLAGAAVVVAFAGHPKVIAGSGGFTAGQRLMTEAGTGRLIPWSPSPSSNVAVAVAISTVASAGIWGAVRLIPNWG